MSDKLVLVDGHSILHRAFYGLPDLTSHDGRHTNAVYGFLNILLKIVSEEQPTHLAVAFDVHHPTFRHEMYAEYKNNRKPMPEELREQVPLMKEVLKSMRILVMEKPGLEADDILGTMANNAEKAGMEVALVSGDRDLLQIASEHIKIRIPKTKPGRTEIEDYYAKDVLDKYNVTPKAFIDLKALMGDSADNYPGVPKVGEKTAMELMVEYGSIDNIYANVESITKKAIKQSLIDNKDLAYLCQSLATIKIDAKIPFTMDDAVIADMFNEESYALFKELDFKNLLSNFEGDMAKSTEIEYKIEIIKNDEALQLYVKNIIKSSNKVAVKVWTSKREDNEEASGQFSLFDEPASSREGFLGVCGDGANCVFADFDNISFETVRDILLELYESNITILTSRVKELYSILDFDNKTSKEVGSHFFDAIIGAYIINPLKNDYEVSDIYREYMASSVPSYEELMGKKPIFDEYKEKDLKDSVVKYCLNEVYGIYSSHDAIKSKLEKSGMWDLYSSIEMPVSYVLYSMEHEGVLVNRDELRLYGKRLGEGIEKLEESIYSQAGKEFNINSPKQLGELLFEDMGIQGGKKTKTGYSTAADVLEKLAPDYPIIKDILEYRTLTKLKSTYAEGLDNYIEADGRIHTNFNQTITATGRISSTEPNLQNIPMRMELGRQIRKVFIPKNGYIFTDADYSQVELRILASMSEDKELIDAYRSEVDVHKATASKVFHVPLDEVTDIQRRNAKAVNFGIVYGISSFGLSQDLSITKAEAKQYIEDYFQSFPGIKNFLDNCKEQAKKTGYSVTAYGRRRPIPELKSSNFMQRGFGERVAMNAPIQGTAADVMKIGMINVFDSLVNEGLKSKLILQVHDELIIETLIEEKDIVERLLVEGMKNAGDFKVTLEVSAESGTDWYEAK